jgi:hypothetical protein
MTASWAMPSLKILSKSFWTSPMESAIQECQMVCFQTKKSQYGSILEGLAMKIAGIFYAHSVYFTAIENILWPFDIFCGHLVYFFPFLYVVTRKIWQPCCNM